MLPSKTLTLLHAFVTTVEHRFAIFLSSSMLLILGIVVGGNNGNNASHPHISSGKLDSEGTLATIYRERVEVELCRVQSNATQVMISYLLQLPHLVILAITTFFWL
jgi:hypothetical protein